MSDFLEDLVTRARDSVECRAVLRRFLDDGRIIARCRIDEAATIAAGRIVLHYEPSDSFRDAFAEGRFCWPDE